MKAFEVTKWTDDEHEQVRTSVLSLLETNSSMPWTRLLREAQASLPVDRRRLIVTPKACPRLMRTLLSDGVVWYKGNEKTLHAKWLKPKPPVTETQTSEQLDALVERIVEKLLSQLCPKFGEMENNIRLLRTDVEDVLLGRLLAEEPASTPQPAAQPVVVAPKSPHVPMPRPCVLIWNLEKNHVNTIARTFPELKIITNNDRLSMGTPPLADLVLVSKFSTHGQNDWLVRTYGRDKVVFVQGMTSGMIREIRERMSSLTKV